MPLTGEAQGISVLVVDDSMVVRQAVRQVLLRDPAISRVDTASDGQVALAKMRRMPPHVVTLDLGMPGMDGIETLERMRWEAPCPVLLVTGEGGRDAERTIRALELGALDLVAKPEPGSDRGVEAIAAELTAKVLALARAGGHASRTCGSLALRAPEAKPRPGQKTAPWLVVMGASTGGTEALRHVLSCVPAATPAAFVLVQHMPRGFTAAFASRLDRACAMVVKEAAPRDLLVPGRVLVAPGGLHLHVAREGAHAWVELRSSPKVNGHRPSVDVLFQSAAEAYGSRTVAVILTGMGRDGARGMRGVADAGGTTLAQDEPSSVVYGMPRAAVEEGGVRRICALADVAAAIGEALPRPDGRRSQGSRQGNGEEVSSWRRT